MCGIQINEINETSLKIHERNFHGDVYLECEQCGNEFKGKTKLKTHKKKVHENEYYDCDVCGIQCNEINEINTHKRDMHEILTLNSIR